MLLIVWLIYPLPDEGDLRLVCYQLLTLALRQSPMGSSTGAEELRVIILRVLSEDEQLALDHAISMGYEALPLLDRLLPDAEPRVASARRLARRAPRLFDPLYDNRSLPVLHLAAALASTIAEHRLEPQRLRWIPILLREDAVREWLERAIVRAEPVARLAPHVRGMQAFFSLADSPKRTSATRRRDGRRIGYSRDAADRG